MLASIVRHAQAENTMLGNRGAKEGQAMTTWRIQYQDKDRTLCECFGECQDTPDEHEALELVVESLIIAARTAIDANLYLRTLAANSISAIEIVKIESIEDLCLDKSLPNAVPGIYTRAPL